MQSWPPRSLVPARYGMRGSSARSDEDASQFAIELVVVWSGDVLNVSHFPTPGAVFVGAGGSCDVALPPELLGAERRCVAVSSRGDVCVVLPASVPGWLTLPDGSILPFSEQTSALPHDPAQPTERLLPLELGYRAHLCFAHLEIQVATVHPGRRSPREIGLSASMLASLGLCTLTLLSFMAVLSRLTPAPGLNHNERTENAQLRVLRTYLAAAAEREQQTRSEGDGESAETPAPKPPPRPLLTQQAALAVTDAEAETLATVDTTLGLDTIDAPARDPIQRREQIQEARKYGLIGMLDWPELRDPKLKFERHMSSEELALMERVFMPEFALIPEGPGGLTLSGTGIGGGGEANVVALQAVRTVDEGQGGGLGRFPGGRHVPDVHTSPVFAVQHQESIVSDPLATASVRSAVHEERAALHGCYADALGSGPLSTTTILVRFVVLGSGQIGQVSASHPALPEGVNRCIERVFRGLSVPNPVSRPVHVTYRVALDS